MTTLRNPILASFIAKGILPYKGLGSGIKRALAEWPHIEFIDDRESCLFTAVVHRKFGETAESSEKTDDKILGLVRNYPQITISELADTLQLSTRTIGNFYDAL